ncbi:GTP-binding protein BRASSINAZOLE INSENSITIVE PALE GREEN 2, chloroplastic-like [Phragmites australis]|uniref:GTP-binding protein BRASSINAZOLE INSENSITIVE PALE GREEN 2, chloroplastic-like n=1 Tax=Phragmites australis TaxID=29695 RepID=UPI002D780869|nr:GTP-binding protein BRASSINAZOLE INSENSITIVE PALE GREEN 2, chloroplastic-like [Phragmites australis]
MLYRARRLHPALRGLLPTTPAPSPPPLPPHHPASAQTPKPFPILFRRHLCSPPPPTPPPSPPPAVVSSDLPAINANGVCPGCGIAMQSFDPALPGFFTLPSPKPPDYRARLAPVTADDTRISASLKSGHLREGLEASRGDELSAAAAEAAEANGESKVVVCARCHSLRHYGRVKHPDAERLLPDFDFVAAVGPRLASPSGARSLVLLLADASDFDGSFPRAVARLVAAADEAHHADWKRGAPANLPRSLLVVTKLDLLPTPSLSPDDVHAWAHTRARAGAGADLRLAGVHLVSAARGWGVRDLLDHVRELAGARGNVWAVGARNVGKSTLLNAIARCSGIAGRPTLTEAPVPGTTLGVIKVDGVLGAQAKLFDTPGLLHGHRLTSRLTREELKLVQVSKEMRPRTYRIKTGQSIHIGGLVRLDIQELTVGSIYVTVWASALVPLHMGKAENAATMIKEHFGLQLQPPIGQERVNELGKWVRKQFKVSGNSWEANSMDIAIAGLGWFGVGLKGEAVLGLWTYDGVDVVSRSSLIHERATIFEEAGFIVSKIVSQADSMTNKLKSTKRTNKKKESRANSSPSTSPEPPEPAAATDA